MRMVVDECSSDCLRLRLKSQDGIYLFVGAMFNDQSSAQLLSLVKTWLKQNRFSHRSPRATRRQ
jgi:hypothetical protein